MRTTIGGSDRWQDSLAECRLVILAVVTSAIVLIGQGTWAQQPCSEECGECMRDCVCQADGSCVGVPKDNGSPCNADTPCTSNGTCQGGTCVGTAAPDGTPCSYPFLGLCAR